MGNSRMMPVIVAGTLVLDLYPPLLVSGDQPLAQRLIGGQVIEAGALAVSAGGVVPNTGINLHKLGVPVYLVARIADDLLGQAIRSIFEQHRVDTRHMTEVTGASPYSIVLSPPGTDRIFIHYPGLNDTFTAEDIDWSLAQTAGILHLGYPVLLPALYADGGQPLADLLARAKALGVTTSVDMCMVPRDSEPARQDWGAILERVLPYVDILMPGVEEMLFLLDRRLFEALQHKAGGDAVLSAVEPAHVMQLADTLLAMGANVVALKAGDRGIYLRTASADQLDRFGRATPANSLAWANRELWEPGFRPHAVVTAVGAGDAAVAGFLAGLLRGRALHDCLRLAAALGAMSLEAPDALGGVGTWDETLARLSAGWPKNHVVIDHPGWRFDATQQHWIGPRDAGSTTMST